MNKKDKIFIAFHHNMIGSAIFHHLKTTGYTNTTTTKEDMTIQSTVEDFFRTEKPDYVFLPSARVGGIMDNSRFSADFIYTNLVCQTNIIHAAWRYGVKKLLYLGSSCIYPRDCPQPMKEEYLLTGKVETTSEPYAIAKIAGIELCQSYNRQYGTKYLSVVPSDVYGPEDDFNPVTGHVLPALMSKTTRAAINHEQEMIVWGTGTPRREALHVNDLAEACIFLMDNYEASELINVGSGKDISIKDLAFLMKNVTGYKGTIKFDTSKPDGMTRKLLDISRISKLGWSPKINMEEGIRQTYEWFKKNVFPK